jgi:hypothetical protein
VFVFRMPKKYGSVGVYVARYARYGSNDDALEFLVHRRSSRVSTGRNCIATPGGFVDKSDLINENGICLVSAQ